MHKKIECLLIAELVQPIDSQNWQDLDDYLWHKFEQEKDLLQWKLMLME